MLPKTSHSVSHVLILDADMIPSLSVARSLHRQGVFVDMGYPDVVREPPLATYSRACRHSFPYPNPLLDQQAFMTWLRNIHRRNDYDLIVPVTERTLVAMLDDPDLSSFRSQLAIPPVNALQKVLDKDATIALAESEGIPCPRRNLVNDIETLEELAKSTEFPVVLKPCSSISHGTRNDRRQLSVDYAFSERELLDKGRNLLEESPLLLQQYVRGEGTGIELIADKGEVRLVFQHRRLHEQPLSGGGSCYRESVSVEPRLLDAAKRLMKALQWHGVAMVEFKYDPVSGDFWLMEINGRFWGSLPLSVAAGADFPWLLYLLHTRGRLPQDIPSPKIGIHCRKLSADLLWYEQVLRGSSDPRLFTRPSGRALIGDALRIFTPGHRFDVQSFSDPLPGTIDLYRIIRQYATRVTDLVADHMTRRRLASTRESRRIGNALGRSRNILFVCHGNINRSALAEVMLREKILENAPDRQIRSAGFHPKEGRPADPRMKLVARSRNVDLDGSVSTILDQKLIDWADLIFVMEIRHLDKLEAIAPGSSRKAALLGSLAPENRNPEIPDPYGQDPGQYESCYLRIEAAIDKLASMLVDTPAAH